MVKEGIILYSIESDGCLNGVYTNEHKKAGGIICNEIARIKDKNKIGQDGISGLYNCYYFEETSGHEVELNVTVVGRTYNFEWIDLRSKCIFKGQGYKMNKTQIAVHYWSV